MWQNGSMQIRTQNIKWTLVSVNNQKFFTLIDCNNSLTLTAPSKITRLFNFPGIITIMKVTIHCGWHSFILQWCMMKWTLFNPVTAFIYSEGRLALQDKPVPFQRNSVECLACVSVCVNPTELIKLLISLSSSSQNLQPHKILHAQWLKHTAPRTHRNTLIHTHKAS